MALAIWFTGYFSSIAAGREEEQAMPIQPIEATLKAHTDALMAMPGVVGVGQGLIGVTPCIKVFVVEKSSALQKQIPKALDGHPVIVEQTGEFRALPKR
ncbi:MAG: hypothetical protein ACU88J_02760 [Gammaproteobacteria bacterium]